MSDSLLNTYFRYGTNAERLAFTPDPPQISGVDVQVIYIWRETDTGDVYIYDTAWHVLGTGPTSNIRVISFPINGGGSVITTGYKTAVKIPFACTITKAILLSNDPASTVGSAVVRIVKDTTFPPSTSIVASDPPTLTAANKSENTTLTGWTTAIAANDYLGVNVISASTVLQLTLEVVVTVP